MSHDPVRRIIEQNRSLTREIHAGMQGDWAARDAERRHQETLAALEPEHQEHWPAAWTLAAALFAGNALRNAVQGPEAPAEPTQVLEARVIREEPQRALEAPPMSRFQVAQLVLLVAIVILLLVGALG